MRWTVWALAVVLGCGWAAPAPAGNALQVWVSILPQKYVIERIGGDLVEAHVLVGSSQSPATFEPTPLRMADLHDADLYFRIGVPFETSLLRKLQSTLPGLPVIEGRAGVELKTMSGEPATGLETSHTGHQHGPDEPDPHFWLDPSLLADHAGTVLAAMCERAPQNCPEFTKRTARLRADLERLDQEIDIILEPFEGRTVLVYHPAYGYFARRYGLRLAVVEFEGKEPEARALAGLIDRARADGIGTVFVQPQFSSRRAQTLANAVDGKVVPLEPLAENYAENLKDMARRIATSFEP